MKGNYMRTNGGWADDSVAVVIGALLTFVIVVSLMSAFVLWYVPSNGQTNELNYDLQTENSFIQMQNQMGNGTIFPNQFVVQSFTVGIPGTPPFSSNSDTQILFKNSGAYSANISYGLTVKFDYNGALHVSNIEGKSTSNGQILVDAFTSFVPPEIYCYQDNTIVERQVGSNFSQIIGALPFEISTTSSGISLRTSQFSISGNNTSYGGFGSTIVTMQYSHLNQNNFFKNENLTVYDPQTGTYTPAVVSAISLDYLDYNITNQGSSAWNSTLFTKYAKPGSLTGNKTVGVQWLFSSYDFKAEYLNNTFSIESTSSFSLYSANLDQFTLNLLEL